MRVWALFIPGDDRRNVGVYTPGCDRNGDDADTRMNPISQMS